MTIVFLTGLFLAFMLANIPRNPDVT